MLIGVHSSKVTLLSFEKNWSYRKSRGIYKVISISRGSEAPFLDVDIRQCSKWSSPCDRFFFPWHRMSFCQRMWEINWKYSNYIDHFPPVSSNVAVENHWLIWLAVSNIFFIFHFIYGMSSFPLTFTPSFFKMVKTTNQSFIDDVSNKTSMFLWGISHCQVTEDAVGRLTKEVLLIPGPQHDPTWPFAESEARKATNRCWSFGIIAQSKIAIAMEAMVLSVRWFTYFFRVVLHSYVKGGCAPFGLLYVLFSVFLLFLNSAKHGAALRCFSILQRGLRQDLTEFRPQSLVPSTRIIEQNNRTIIFFV